jgi:hypothetical protein
MASNKYPGLTRSFRLSTAGLTEKVMKGVGLVLLAGVNGGMVGKVRDGSFVAGIGVAATVGVGLSADFEQAEIANMIRKKSMAFLSIVSPFSKKAPDRFILHRYPLAISRLITILRVVFKVSLLNSCYS